MTDMTPITVRPIDGIACFAPPGDTPRMHDLRCRLATARCVASAAIARWNDHTDEARTIYGIISQTACEFVYAAVPTETLEAAVALSRRLLVVALQIDILKGNTRA